MENNEKKSKAGIWLALIMIILLVLVGALYYMKYVDQPKANVESNTNTETAVSEKTSAKLTMTEEEFPKVDGATAMLPMIGEMTKNIMGYTEEEAQKYLDEYTQGKTAKVYKGLIDKKTDVIFASEPSDDILKQAKEAGVEFEMVGIGYDGFVFLVNQANKVNSLTLEQIQDIYTGDITNWKEVGGEDAEIIAYQREQNSGSQNLMEKMVMKGKKMKDPASNNLMISSMEGLIDGVASYENSKYSIGYSIYLYAKEQYVKNSVKFLKINGVEATDENISNKSYPLTKVVYAIMRKDEPENSSARKLVKYLLTEEGQKIVKAGGYVTLNQK